MNIQFIRVGNVSDTKTIETKEAVFKAKTIIIATGAQSKKLGVPGEKEFIYDSVVKEIKGENVVNTAVLENVKTKEQTALPLDGVFPYVGFSPNVDGINGQLEQDSNGFIITDETMHTSQKGVFAVGDVRNTPLRQVITAASDGAVGAVYAVKYLEAVKETVSA